MYNFDFERAIKEIIDALHKKGYDPYEQLMWYLMTGNVQYITRYNDARSKIASMDKGHIADYLKTYKK